MPNIIIESAPLDFLAKAKSDFDSFLRDSRGMPTVSILPLFGDSSKVYNCIDNTLVNPIDDSTITLCRNQVLTITCI
jgi:hypothetical protein